MNRGRGEFETMCREIQLLQEGSTISVCCITKQSGERLIEKLKIQFPQHHFELLIAGQSVRGRRFNVVMEDVDTNWADDFQVTHPDFAARSEKIKDWFFRELLPTIKRDD